MLSLQESKKSIPPAELPKAELLDIVLPEMVFPMQDSRRNIPPPLPAKVLPEIALLSEWYRPMATRMLYAAALSEIALPGE
jgi:hypothetical protein